MNLRKELFWDSDFSKIDLDLHRDLIIQRIVDYGLWEEFHEVLAYYGNDETIKSLLNNTELSARGAYFSSHFFSKELHEFKCVKKRQSIPIDFSY